MKNNIYVLFLLITAGLASCRKDKTQQTIKEYDDEQIRNYISANGLTNMKRDVTGGDTSGIYYEILGQGTGPAVDATTLINTTYTIKTLDGSFSQVDSIVNHNYSYAGQYFIFGALAPEGVRLAMTNLVKRQGTRLHILVPSRLAFGRSGGLIAGSIRIGGNKPLDMYINVVNNVAVDQQGTRYANNIDTYDAISIQKYIAANNLTGFTPVTVTSSAVNKGVTFYYKVRTPGTGTVAINESSVVTFEYRGTLLNGTVVVPANYSATGTQSASATYYMSNPGNPNDQTVGLREALLLAKVTGTEFTIIVPSRLAYGLTGYSTYPSHSCVMFDATVNTVVN